MKFDDSGSKKREKYDFGVIFEVPGPENPQKSRKPYNFKKNNKHVKKQIWNFKFGGWIPTKFERPPVIPWDQRSHPIRVGPGRSWPVRSGLGRSWHSPSLGWGYPRGPFLYFQGSGGTS